MLSSNLHFVNNDNICADDKLMKIHSIIKKICGECASTCPSLLKVLQSCMLTCLVLANKMFFGNWFSQYELLYLNTEGILSVGRMRGNRLQG